MEIQAKNRTVRPDGEAVKRLRLAKGWRVEDLAKRAVCSVKTIENVERGANVYMFTLAKIAKQFGVEFETLIDGGKPPPDPPKPQSAIQIQFVMSIPFDQFDESAQLGGFIEFLKQFLRGGGDINVVGVTPGSTIITVEVAGEDVRALLSAYKEGKLAEMHCVGLEFGQMLDPALLASGFKHVDPKLSGKTPMTGDKSKDFTRSTIEPQPGKDKKHEPKPGA
jgi:transcriptional regulator with XRE-family HTH domain